MKEAMDQQLIAIKSNQVLDHFSCVYVVAQDFVHFGDPEAFEEFHDENTRRSDFAVNTRNDDEVAVPEKLAEPLDIVCLVIKIHFLGNHARELFDDRPRGPNDVMINELFKNEDEILNDPDIDRDEFFHPRTKHFNDDIIAAISSAMHLSKRRRGKRFGVKRFEDGIQRTFQLGLDSFSNFRSRKRRNTVVQVAKLFHINLRDDVCTDSKHLGQLDKART